MEAARKGAAAASRWDPLFKSEVYVAQRQLAGSRVPEDETVRAALDALLENQGRLPLTLLAQRLEAHVTATRSTIADLQRILNVDGYSVLRLNDSTHTIELDSALFVKLFDLETHP